MFASPEDASRWLAERLDRLEDAIGQAPELRRIIQDGRGEVLMDVEGDPWRFAQDAADRLRRYASQVTQLALKRLAKEGFQTKVLEEMSLDLIGKHVHTGSAILQAMAETLRERTETLSERGTQLYEEGRTAFRDATAEISAALRLAHDDWSTRGPGRLARSRLPWRRRRAERLRPMDDPAFRDAANEAVQRHVSTLEAALRKVGEGSVLLGTSKYYGDVVNALGTTLAAGENLHDKGRLIAMRARQELDELRRQAASGPGAPANADLLDDETLDAILDRLDVNPTALLRRGDLNAEDLAHLTAEELDPYVRGWVEAQLGGLAAPSLADVLGGITQDAPTVRRQLLGFLARGQPLMHFNDDLPLVFEGGLRGQVTVLAQVTDGSLDDELREVCRHVGFPDPWITRVPPDKDGRLELRLLQFVAGLPFFAQVDRLMPLVELHDQVLGGDDAQSLGGTIKASMLRETRGDEALPDIIPDAVRRAFEHERRLGDTRSDASAPSPTDVRSTPSQDLP